MDRTQLEDLYLGGLETHDLDEIRAAFEGGLDPSWTIRGRSLTQWMTEMYFRSSKFPDIANFILDQGAALDDPQLEPVFRNDVGELARRLTSHPELVEHRTSLVSVFSPLEGAPLLHVAAEYGLIDVARALLDAGADPNGTADVDGFGLNGQTPIFHTVNSNWNHALPIMRLLLERGARVDVQLKGIVWGRNQDWETTLFDVTPISYAQFGLLPQFHRRSREIYDNVIAMLQSAGRPVPPLDNIPNQYSKDFATER